MFPPPIIDLPRAYSAFKMLHFGFRNIERFQSSLWGIKSTIKLAAMLMYFSREYNLIQNSFFLMHQDDDREFR